MKKYILLIVTSFAAGSFAHAKRIWIQTEAQDGISAVSCWRGNPQAAVNKAVSAGWNYCVENYGGQPEEGYEKVSEYCGQASTPVSICPYVCTARVKTYCNY